jgi:hypothetical protein
MTSSVHALGSAITLAGAHYVPAEKQLNGGAIQARLPAGGVAISNAR